MPPIGYAVEPMVNDDASTSEMVPVGAHAPGASNVPVTVTEAPTVSSGARVALGVPISTNTLGPVVGVNTKPSIAPFSGL